MSSDYASYFSHRGVSGDSYSHYVIPAYLENRLPQNKDAHILDFGSGFGQIVRELKGRGYASAIGYDIEPMAIEYCRANDIPVMDGNRLKLADQAEKYDLIVSCHVLEHIPKSEVIEILGTLRGMLRPTGSLLICVPNAQSNTGAYWAFEDFTHHTLFTSGSLYYVLSKAGFSRIDFIDLNCTEGLPPLKRLLRRVFLALYRANYRFWNSVTGSATHAPSPDIFSYEVKAVAYY